MCVLELLFDPTEQYLVRLIKTAAQCNVDLFRTALTMGPTGVPPFVGWGNFFWAKSHRNSLLA